MRVDLALQRLQLRLDQARLELRRVERPRLRLAPVGQRVREADEEQIGHEQPVELRQVLREGIAPPTGVVGRQARVDQERCSQHHHRRGVHDGIGQRAGQVHEHLQRPFLLPQRFSHRPGHDHGSQQRRDVPVEQVERQQVQQRVRHRMVVRDSIEPVGLERGRHAERRRDDEQERSGKPFAVTHAGVLWSLSGHPSRRSRVATGLRPFADHSSPRHRDSSQQTCGAPDLRRSWLNRVRVARRVPP